MEIKKRKSVIETIKENYKEFFPAEKKVADFILKNPEKSVDANVSELANFSSVSDATVIRMCKHIGYEGHYQLRINLSRDLGRKQETYVEEANLDNVKNIFNNYAKELLKIGEWIDNKNLQICVDLIISAHYVHIVAVGNTSPLAQYMGFRLGRLGVRCTYNLLPEYFLNHINLAGKKDIVLAISQSGTSKHVVQAMELAKKKGLKLIAVTGHKYSPVSRLADCLLLSNDEEQPFDYYKSYSHLNETAVIDAILQLVTNEDMIIATNANNPEIILSENKL